MLIFSSWLSDMVTPTTSESFYELIIEKAVSQPSWLSSTNKDKWSN